MEERDAVYFMRGLSDIFLKWNDFYEIGKYGGEYEGNSGTGGKP